MIDQIAENTGIERDVANAVVDEFLLLLHRKFVESERDVIAGQLWHELGAQGFYHLLGVLEEFSDQYAWEQGSAREYLLRLGTPTHWLPYFHQTEGWNRRKE